MKLIKCLATLLGLLAVAVPAHSQTVIRIIGSNGDRVATQTAISKILTGWKFQGLTGVATSGSAATLSLATSSNYGAWSGTYSGSPVIVKVSFAGALAGVAAVASGTATTQRYVFASGTGNTAIIDPNSVSAVQGVDYELASADFGFSTNFQSTSPFNGLYNGVYYNPIIEEIVGVSPLGFYASPGFPATNITTQVARLLYKAGSVPLALFTGDFANDANKIVWAIGRNTDAGQRFGAYTEVGIGTTQSVKVYQPTITGATTTSGITYGGTATSHILWPTETVSGIFSSEGNGGYSSGANLAPTLTTVLGPDAYKGKYYDVETDSFQYLYPNATAGYYVGYLTPGDANPRVLGSTNVVPVGNRGVALNYNGVPLTNSNVQNGNYTVWLYNRILKPQSGLTGTKLNFANSLRDQILNVDATAGGGLFYDSSFKVQRATDGGSVIPR